MNALDTLRPLRVGWVKDTFVSHHEIVVDVRRSAMTGMILAEPATLRASVTRANNKICKLHKNPKT